MDRVKLVLFGAAIFLSAFLLFQVQPIAARFAVPWFGGSAAVWTTCLLFFQIALLLGYLYSHGSIRFLRPRAQTTVHIALLLVSVVVVLAQRITPGEFLKPVGTEEPIARILLLLGLTVGLPYFVLSTTGPLLQAWYARHGAQNPTGQAFPYRLYALSNVGSMLALLSYPVLFEPQLTIRQQAWLWSGSYLVFVALCAVIALGVRRTEGGDPRADTSSAPGDALDGGADRVKPGLYLAWLLLAVCPSALLLAVTNHISQNVAAVPLFWVLPLSLYLLSFILCFGGREWRWNKAFLPIPAMAFVAMAYALSSGNENLDMGVLLPIWLAGFFVCCLLCHGELSRLKPSPRHLTAFYLMVSLGGALGGVFVGLLAPRWFNAYYELPISIAACAVVALFALYRDPGDPWWQPSWLILCGLTGVLAVYLGSQARSTVEARRLSVRNFYTVLQVRDSGGVDEEVKRELTNGTILHGDQFLSSSKRTVPTTYYGHSSGVGRAMRLSGARGPKRVGVVGLGTGTLAAYGRPGDQFFFYEINPQVIQIARTEFSYLADSKAQVHVLLGDARLALERQPPQGFDVLAVDAFSSDAIPVHLLTREAFAVYFKHLKPTGVLAVHVSNRHIDLQPVVRHAAEAMNKTAVLVSDDDDALTGASASDWVLVSARRDLPDQPVLAGATEPPASRPNFRGWTDDHSSLFPLRK